jgi:hypothetical protein
MELESDKRICHLQERELMLLTLRAKSFILSLQQRTLEEVKFESD